MPRLEMVFIKYCQMKEVLIRLLETQDDQDWEISNLQEQLLDELEDLEDFYEPEEHFDEEKVSQTLLDLEKPPEKPKKAEVAKKPVDEQASKKPASGTKIVLPQKEAGTKQVASVSAKISSASGSETKKVVAVPNSAAKSTPTKKDDKKVFFEKIAIL